MQKKFSQRTRTVGGRLGLERFRLHLYGKRIRAFSDHQAVELLLKKNKSNKQYSARLTRWRDRINHFDITLKYTVEKEIKFTDLISSYPIEIAEPEEKYEEDFVINAIAQLATVNYRIGRMFNQLDFTKTPAMHDTRRTQTGTRCYKLNNHSNFQLIANRINCFETNNYTLFQPESNQTMSNITNIDCNQNLDRFPRDEDGKLKDHWGAEDTIVRIIERRDKSPETRDLVEQRIALTKPGNMRHHYTKKLERQNIVPRRPDEEEQKEVKRISLRLKQKEEHRITHIGGGYFINFGEQTTQEQQEPVTSTETSTVHENKQRKRVNGLPHTRRACYNTRAWRKSGYCSTKFQRRADRRICGTLCTHKPSHGKHGC